MIVFKDVIDLIRDNPELEERICRLVEKYLDNDEYEKNIVKAHSYIRTLNVRKSRPNPEYIEKYRLYQTEDGKWKTNSAIKLKK